MICSQLASYGTGVFRTEAGSQITSAPRGASVVGSCGGHQRGWSLLTKMSKAVTNCQSQKDFPAASHST